MDADAILALALLLLAGVSSLSWTPLGREIAELGERVDFTERLLAKPRE